MTLTFISRVLLGAALLPISFSVSQAQTVLTNPFGYNRITCLANSDTIVGVPFRKSGSQQTRLSGNPTGTGSSITLPVASTLTAGQLSQHYVKFVGGTKDGYWYDVTSNTTNSITINLNGDTLLGVVSGNSILIAEYWTLNTLFPPVASAGVVGPTTLWAETPLGSGNWVQNGHAIVASSTFARRTEVLVPNYSGVGTNLGITFTFYIQGGEWKVIGSGAPVPAGSFKLYPDNYFLIRHSAIVTRNTSFRTLGEVEMRNFTIPLVTTTGGRQDNFIATPRPIDVKLSELNLSNTDFVNSTTFSRGDELLLFNNSIAQLNRGPSAIYFRVMVSGVPTWRSATTGTVSQNNAMIPAGVGMVIRKASTPLGVTTMWNNTPLY